MVVVLSGVFTVDCLLRDVDNLPRGISFWDISSKRLVGWDRISLVFFLIKLRRVSLRLRPQVVNIQHRECLTW